MTNEELEDKKPPPQKEGAFFVGRLRMGRGPYMTWLSVRWLPQ